MKNILILIAVMAGAGSMAMATTSFDVTFPVSPQGTFLLQSGNDVCAEYNILGCDMNPTFINLTSLSVQAGDTLTITAHGGLCFYANPGCTVYPPDLGAVFSTSNTLLAPSFLNRIPGAIAPGAGATLVGNDPFLYTFAGNLNTTISNDFYIPATVIVPAGATYLVVGVLDSAYADNSSNFLTVELSEVPELGTYALMLWSVGALWVRRRIFRNASNSSSAGLLKVLPKHRPGSERAEMKHTLASLK